MARKPNLYQQFFRTIRIGLFLLPALLVSYSSFSQDIFFDWVTQLDRRQGRTEGYSIAVDDDKNVYIAGGFSNTMDLDPGPGVFNVTTIPGTVSGWDHTFVVKLDPNGNFIWGKDIGGDRYTNCHYLHVEPDGNIYLTGTFSGTTDFDPSPAEFKLTATPTLGPENYDIFTLRLDTDGNFKWAARAGNLGADYGAWVTTDPAGNVFTTGAFGGVADFDPGPGVVNLGGNGQLNTFITKFDRQGNFIWAKHFAGSFSNYGICIRTDDVGNIYLSGSSEGTTDFDPGPGAYPITTGLYSRASYLAKLDPNGAFIWAKINAGGVPFEVDANQQIVTITGWASAYATLSKYDINGNLLWDKKVGGRPATWPDGSSSIVLDAAGNIYLTGEFNYTTDFDPGPGTFNMTAYGGGYNYDAFICRLDANGEFVYAKQFGGWSEEHPTTIALDTSGNIYTIGIFNGIIDADPGPGVHDISTYSGGGVFIHKMSPCKNITRSNLTINACAAYTLNNQTYTKSGRYTQTLRNSSGCDSIITLDLNLLNNTTDITVTACDNYTWNSQLFTTSGLYTHTYTNAAGCDSLVRLQLTINNRSMTTVNISICEGDQYKGYTTDGTYTDVLTAANGCDSIRTLHLTVVPKKHTTITEVICSGQNYAGYTQTGTYVDVLKSAAGCDSIRTLHLTVNPTYAFTVKKTICAGETYLGHGTTGIFIDRMLTVAGCDSIQTTELTVNGKPIDRFGKDTTICTGDSLVLRAGQANSYVWQDGSTGDHFVVRDAGVYRVAATNYCGSTTSNIRVQKTNCTIYFPNAFTPNRDGKNDRFGILNAYNITDYHLRVYNRWGQVIFESHDKAKTWDGNFNGLAQESAVYVWVCSFKQQNDIKNMRGTILLIR